MDKRALKSIFILLLLTLSNSLSTDEFTIGVWYGGGRYRAPSLCRNPELERELWESDLKNISSLGFNMVKVWVDWATVEPVEGQYDFRALRQILEIIKSNNLPLKVIIQVYADSSPDWVSQKYPDGEFVGSNDRHIHSQSAPGYCFDHPGVRELMLKFYNAIGKVAAEFDKLIYGFDIWSEPHVVNWVVFWDMDSERVKFCYCEHSIKRFVEFLKKKYGGDIKKLNDAWYRTFSSWEQVQPPRFGTITTYHDYLDWMYEYIPTKIAEDLSMKSEALRFGFGLTRNVVVSAHSSNPSITGTPNDDYGMADDWKMNNALLKSFPPEEPETSTFYGSSFYPIFPGGTYGGRDNIVGTIAYTGAYSATKRRGFYVGELQAGQGTSGVNINIQVTPDHHRDWIWSLIAHGAKSISIYAYYPMNTGYESNGFGLINLDSSITERAKSAGELAKLITKYQTIFAHSLPEPAQVAILYNPVAYFLGGNRNGPYGELLETTRGLYGGIYDNNPSIPIEFVHANDAENGYLIKGGYKLLIIPFPLAISAKTSEAIMKFVESGGSVVSEARLGWTDDLGVASFRVPGLGLDKYFGTHEEVLRPINKKDSDNFKYTFTEDAPAGLNGTVVRSKIFEEVFIPDTSDAKIIATFSDGKPAVIMRNYSKGKTMIIGSCIGISSNDGDKNARKVIYSLVEWAGIKGLIRNVKNGGENLVPKIIQRDDTKEYTMIVINRGKSECKPTITIGFEADRGIDITDNEKPVPITRNPDGTFNVLLPEIKSKMVCVVHFPHKKSVNLQ